MARTSRGDERCIADSNKDGYGGWDGRFRSWMGSVGSAPFASQRANGIWGFLPKASTIPTHQLQGANGYQVAAAQHEGTNSRKDDQHSNGQHNGNVLRQQAGRTQITLGPTSYRDLGDSGCLQRQDPSGVPAGKNEYGSRPGIQKRIIPMRYATSPTIIPAGGATLGSTLDRPVCLLGEQTTASLCQQRAKSGGGMGRCNEALMDSRKWMDPPPIQHDSEGVGENQEGPRQWWRRGGHGPGFQLC